MSTKHTQLLPYKHSSAQHPVIRIHRCIRRCRGVHLASAYSIALEAATFGLAHLAGRAEAAEERCVGLRVLVKHAGVNGRRQQVVCCRDCVDVAGLQDKPS